MNSTLNKDFFIDILKTQIDWEKYKKLLEEYPDWNNTIAGISTLI